MTEGDMVQSSSKVSQEEHYHLDNYVQGIYNNPRDSCGIHPVSGAVGTRITLPKEVLALVLLVVDS